MDIFSPEFIMNILIVDDHPLFRHALIQAVRYHFSQAYISEISTANDLYSHLETQPEPDLILLDLTLPGASGFSALVHLRAYYPMIPVIIVSAYEDISIIQRAMAHGAMGYIPKSTHPNQIGLAIKEVLDGEIWLPEQMQGQDVAQGMNDEVVAAEKIQSLTQQQFRVLMMLSEGMLNKQIGYTLGISEATIKAHVTAIFKKLGVQNRTQAVLMVQALNIHENKMPMI